MDYAKLDAALAIALEEAPAGQPVLEVFVSTAGPPGTEAITHLEALGVRGLSDKRTTYTAALSPRDIEELSDRPWVKSVRLSRRLKMLADGQASP